MNKKNSLKMDKRIGAVVADYELRFIKAAAKKTGRTVASFVRKATLEMAAKETGESIFDYTKVGMSQK